MSISPEGQVSQVVLNQRGIHEAPGNSCVAVCRDQTGHISYLTLWVWVDGI
jgi:hypothetical protein